MSWQLVSFAIVLAALGGAFWWYERSHPPAKLLALVATLAAIAALGRDAFAAIPDVKPITAIVLISGLAFGARPGFAVGAISALASNILLGEGPWTPWQMLGWGLVGVFGALLARPLGERPAPLVLAVSCAFAAEIFNLVVDVYTWTGSGAHSLAGFGVVLGSALAFDVTHVIASFLFGLAFGTSLLRMLCRVRSRLQIAWEPGMPASAPSPAASMRLLSGPPAALALMLCVPVLVLGASACARATSTSSQATAPQDSAHAARVAIGSELTYLAGAQNADGGFGATPGQPSSELYTAWAAIGIAATGRSPLSVRRGGHTVLDALKAEAASLSGAGDLERTILALHACGASAHILPGGDPVKRLLAFRSSDGSFGHLSNLTAFAILALRAAGERPRQATIQAAARWLARQQDGDGGFGFATKGAGSDVDDTAAAMQALAVAGLRGRPAMARGAAFLRRAQDLDGGYPQQRGGSSNAQSTAWAVQALLAAGRDPAKVIRRGSRSPLAYLESLVGPEGSVRYSRTGTQTPVWVTAQALTALAEKPLPIAPPPA
jgi:energy-coupling factor transport system substrate-specific component